jgi:Icc protein
MNSQFSRRRFLQASTTAAAFVAGRGLVSAAEGIAGPTEDPEPTAIRFVHLTDIHVQEERRADQGLAKCLTAVMGLDPLPEFILTGGDLVMDAFEQDEQRARSLFSLLRKLFDDHAGVPVHHCIGNHDVFAWGTESVGEDHPQYGKKMVSEYLELPNRYYRFDHKGWRFYVLDDIQPAPNRSYQAHIDEAQMAWLEDDLRAKPPEMPAAAVCHIPILTVTAFGNVEEDAYRVPTNRMCRGAQRLIDLFSANNVRLALSGHLHQLDRIEFRGVTFICDGAVCGGWWRGPNKGFEEGFGVLDLNPDGSINHHYFDYAWEATPTRPGRAS